MKNVKYASIKAYYRGFIDGECKFFYRCSYCLYSNDGTPGKKCDGCGRILVDKDGSDESAD